MKGHPFVREIVQNFKKKDRYLAHQASAPVLSAMAGDIQFFHEVVKANLADPTYLRKTRHYPTLAMNILETDSFHLVAHLWLPMPMRPRDISIQNIHHHGDLLLSTVNAFGPGYESILFKNDFEIDPRTGETQMTIDKISQHGPGKIDFIERQTPHLVFCPGDTSITFALWSNYRQRPLDELKKLDWIRKIRRPMARFLTKVGLSRTMGINAVRYLDFYVENQKIWGLADRLGYEEGTNENFLKNLFHLLQRTKFSDLSFLSDLKSRPDFHSGAGPWIDRFLSGEVIESEFEQKHIGLPKLSLKKQDVLEALSFRAESPRAAIG